MVLLVRCSLCNEIIECKTSNKIQLYYHIRDKHPEIALSHIENSKSFIDFTGMGSKREHLETNSIGNGKFATGDDSIESISNQQRENNNQQTNCRTTPSSNDLLSQRMERKSGRKCLHERKHKNLKPLKMKTIEDKKHRLYRTTVEKWRPGQSEITCPTCGKTGTPIIKTQHDHDTKSKAGAAFILACWPFCFLPFLFPPPTYEHLYCCVCNHFLGTYDHRKNILQAEDCG